MTERFVGAVLAGGASRRMGSDKAVLAVGGVPMVVGVADALRSAGAERVVVVGGDRPALLDLGLDVVPDLHPHDGPLGGIVTALEATDAPVVVVAACDMPLLAPAQVAALLDALDPLARLGDRAPVAVAVAVGVDDGRVEPMLSAWRRSALTDVRASFASGERAPVRAISQLAHVAVDLGPTGWSRDVDTVADLDAVRRARGEGRD